MPSLLRSERPALASSTFAFAASCGKAGADDEYHVLLPGVRGPYTGSAAPRNTVLTIASRSMAYEIAWRKAACCRYGFALTALLPGVRLNQSTCGSTLVPTSSSWIDPWS